MNKNVSPWQPFCETIHNKPLKEGVPNLLASVTGVCGPIHVSVITGVCSPTRVSIVTDVHGPTHGMLPQASRAFTTPLMQQLTAPLA